MRRRTGKDLDFARQVATGVGEEHTGGICKVVQTIGDTATTDENELIIAECNFRGVAGLSLQVEEKGHDGDFLPEGDDFVLIRTQTGAQIESLARVGLLRAYLPSE